MMDINYLIKNKIDVNKSLEILGDIETYNETLVDFLTDIAEKLANIKQYKEQKDMPNYAIMVHSLKSDARYLGFTKLAELAYNHEMESKSNNINYVYEHYDELINEVHHILEIVNNYFDTDIESSNETNIKQENVKKSILIADDSNIIRNIIEKMVGDEYTIISATDGKEAIEKIDKKEETLIGMLLDLNMPNVDGFEVLKHLKENNLFGSIPVAIITGDDSKETIYKAFDYPIVDVLAKPFNESDVKRVITAMINLK